MNPTIPAPPDAEASCQACDAFIDETAVTHEGHVFCSANCSVAWSAREVELAEYFAAVQREEE